MDGTTLFFAVVGAAALAHWFGCLLDRMEGRR